MFAGSGRQQREPSTRSTLRISSAHIDVAVRACGSIPLPSAARARLLADAVHTGIRRRLAQSALGALTRRIADIAR